MGNVLPELVTGEVVVSAADLIIPDPSTPVMSEIDTISEPKHQPPPPSDSFSAMDKFADLVARTLRSADRTLLIVKTSTANSSLKKQTSLVASAIK